MKRVTFVGTGDFELTLQPDFSDAAIGEPGLVRVQANGIDVEGAEVEDASVWGFYTPDEAREIAKYLIEVAEKAEAGEA